MSALPEAEEKKSARRDATMRLWIPCFSICTRDGRHVAGEERRDYSRRPRGESRVLSRKPTPLRGESMRVTTR